MKSCTLSSRHMYPHLPPVSTTFCMIFHMLLWFIHLLVLLQHWSYFLNLFSFLNSCSHFFSIASSFLFQSLPQGFQFFTLKVSTHFSSFLHVWYSDVWFFTVSSRVQFKTMSSVHCYTLFTHVHNLFLHCSLESVVFTQESCHCHHFWSKHLLHNKFSKHIYPDTTRPISKSIKTWSTLLQSRKLSTPIPL